MKIGILGTGGVGRTIAAKLEQLGHEVMIGTRDVQRTMANNEKNMMGGAPYKEWQAQHTKVELGTHDEAAAFGEIVINATSGGGTIEALRLAAQVTRQSPLAVRHCKQLIQGARHQPLNSMLAQERERFVDLFDAEDTLEGINAFLDKRPPQWTNR